MKSSKPRKGHKEAGASLVEYALLLALIALTGIASVQTLGGAIETSLFDSSAAIQGAGGFCVPSPLDPCS